MDDVFGSENFVSQIVYTKTAGFTGNYDWLMLLIILFGMQKILNNINIETIYMKEYDVEGRI